MKRLILAGIVAAFLAACWIAWWQQAFPCGETPERVVTISWQDAEKVDSV